MTTASGDESAVSRTVIEAVAEATEREATDLQPLYRTVDPDALDALLAPRPSGADAPLALAFEYAGRQIRAERTDGDAVTVTVQAPTE